MLKRNFKDWKREIIYEFETILNIVIDQWKGVTDINVTCMVVKI